MLLCLDVVFEYVLVPEYGELLLNGGFLLGSDVKLMESRMNVFHD